MVQRRIESLVWRRMWIEAPITVLAILAATFVLAAPADAQTNCGTIQEKVNAAPEGGTVDLPNECVYRERVIINKPLTLTGGDGVEIRGSDVWTGWTKVGAYWVSDEVVPNFVQGTGVCQAGTGLRCQWPEQVFINGKPLTQVASNPAGGQFAIDDSDGNRRVVLADDPAGRTVEVTVREEWIVGQSGGVTIQGFTMKHAANESQSGALYNGNQDNWTVRNNVLSNAHGVVVQLRQSTGSKLLNNNVYRAGQLGVSAYEASDLTISGNRIHHNNTEFFYQSWVAGGIKLAGVQGTTVTANRIYKNQSNGVWVDEGGANNTISDNVVYHNTRNGIHYEVSRAGKIYGNTVYENGWSTDGSAYRAGIQVTASRGVEVRGNTLAWNANSIKILGQDRGTTKTWYGVKNVSVHHNTILAKNYAGVVFYGLGWINQTGDGSMFDAAQKNRGYQNKYWYGSAESADRVRYSWQIDYSKLFKFNATRGEEEGRYLTKTQKDRVISSTGIPASPVKRSV